MRNRRTFFRPFQIASMLLHLLMLKCGKVLCMLSESCHGDGISSGQEQLLLLRWCQMLQQTRWNLRNKTGTGSSGHSSSCCRQRILTWHANLSDRPKWSKTGQRRRNAGWRLRVDASGSTAARFVGLRCVQRFFVQHVVVFVTSIARTPRHLVFLFKATPSVSKPCAHLCMCKIKIKRKND